MYEDIRKNKIITGLIVSIFLGIISAIVYFLMYIWGYSEYAMFFAFVISIISTWATYFYCDKIVIASTGARPASPEEFAKLNHVLDGLMVASELEYRPKLYVMDSKQPNAFATGRNPENAVICVTSALLEKLDYYELEGVIAHELSHVKNYDIRLSAVISVMVGFVVMLSDLCLRFSFRGGRSNDRDSANIVILLVGFICLLLSPLASQLIQLAVSRRREYLADATAVSFTRNPDGLISALKKISGDTNKMDVASNANAFMYIESPFAKKRKKDKSTLFSTHPAINERIEALEKLR